MITQKSLRLRESCLLDECELQILRCAQDLWRTYGQSLEERKIEDIWG